ncbi:MAG: SBBP repeat-containing protein [Bacteroidetes bacterium]|nr:SBBP repeat-containing protein [Bacteroidota bacterium]
MKKQYTTFVIALLSLNTFAQAPNWQWAKSAGGIGYDYGQSIAVDINGNSYVTGNFSSPTITFGATTLNNAGLKDMYVVKYDSSGNVVWAKSAGGIDEDFGYSISVDINGNSYITGWFRSPTITFGPTTLTNAGNDDIYIVKYDTNGNVVWANSAGGGDDDRGYGITVDAFGNSYLTGPFVSPTITFGTTTLIHVFGTDIYVVKYDANGNPVWAKAAAGTGGSGMEAGFSIAVDTSGNSYVTGGFTSATIAFDTTVLSNTTMGGIFSDIFFVKYNANGNVVWAKSMGGNGDDEGLGITTDKSGNSYIAGNFRGSNITIDTITLINSGTSVNTFVVKFNASGNVDWANSSSTICTGIAIDASGNSYVTGEIISPITTIGTTTLNSAGYFDLYVVKYNAIGNVVWAKAAGGIAYEYSNSIAVDPIGNSYVTGYFNSPGITIGATTLNNVSVDDMYIAKLDSMGAFTGFSEIHSLQPEITISPNPFTSLTTIRFLEEQKNTTIKIIDMIGKEIRTINFTGRQFTIEKNEMVAGIYFVQITDEKKSIVKKKIIIH